MGALRRATVGVTMLAIAAIGLASCGDGGAVDDPPGTAPVVGAVESDTTPPAAADTTGPAIEPTRAAPVEGTAPSDTAWPDFWPCRYTDPGHRQLTPAQERRCTDDERGGADTSEPMTVLSAP